MDHLFAYERQDLLQDFIEARFGHRVEPQPKNVSPKVEAVLSPDVEAAFRAARPADFALYDRVVAAGGVLREFHSS